MIFCIRIKLRMNIHHVLFFCFLSALQDGNTGLVNAISVYAGAEGGNGSIICSLTSSGSTKFFCKGECKEEDILIKTDGVTAQSGRYSISYEDGSSGRRTVTVTFTQLTKSDSGRYTCGLGGSSVPDAYRDFDVIVTDAATLGENTHFIRAGTVGGNITSGCLNTVNGSRKFFCKDECKKEEDILVKTEENRAQNGRYSIEYREGSTYGLYLTITQLKKSDTGRYRCGYGRALSPDSSNTFQIFVVDAPTTSKPNWTLRPFPTSVPSASTPTTTQSLISSSGSFTPSSSFPETTEQFTACKYPVTHQHLKKINFSYSHHGPRTAPQHFGRGLVRRPGDVPWRPIFPAASPALLGLPHPGSSAPIPAPRPPSSVNDIIIEPSLPSGSRGRSRTRRLKEVTHSRRSLQPRSRSQSPPKRTSRHVQRSPRHKRTDRSSVPNMSEWTVARLNDSILRQRLGSRRCARDDVRDVMARRSARRTPSSSATSASPVQAASNRMQALSAPQPFLPPTFSSSTLTSHTYTSHHPSIPSSSLAPISAAPSLPATSAAPPPVPTMAATQTAPTIAGPSSSTSYTQPFPPLSSFHPPYPPPPTTRTLALPVLQHLHLLIQRPYTRPASAFSWLPHLHPAATSWHHPATSAPPSIRPALTCVAHRQAADPNCCRPLPTVQPGHVLGNTGPRALLPSFRSSRFSVLRNVRRPFPSRCSMPPCPAPR
ncbi:mucin-5AC-like isoform X5 [Thunnus maccoyii]|uniref:mucin-5AC-like isoform X5 n=1 Tax=Thunnus maccoyii TaxID=8240 RepID=UPI001C4C44C4|nr:mucin-5AC-like isoform X5 [Thunnus maccoyii]